MAVRDMARACRRAGADDEILGADHDRRDLPCGADSPRATKIPALAGAVGCDCDAWGRDDPASDLAQERRLRAADLCRRRLWPFQSRAKRLARARLCRAQSGAARRAGGARGAGAAVAPTSAFADLVARPESGRERVAGAQRLDHPAHRRDRAAARRSSVYGLHEDRLGNLAVLPRAVGAGRDPRAAHSGISAVSYHRDLARPHARDARRRADHRRARDGGISQQLIDLWRARAVGARAHASLARSFWFALGGGCRYDRGRRAHDLLQPRPSGAVHAGRTVVVGADVAGGGEAPWVHRHLRHHGWAAACLRSLDEGECAERRAAGDDDAALLPWPSGAGNQLENLYRPAGEIAGAGNWG